MSFAVRSAGVGWLEGWAYVGDGMTLGPFANGPYIQTGEWAWDGSQECVGVAKLLLGSISFHLVPFPIVGTLVAAPSSPPSPEGGGICRGQGCEVPAFAGTTGVRRNGQEWQTFNLVAFRCFPIPLTLTLRPLPEGQGAGMRGSRLRGNDEMLFVRTTYANNVASGGAYGAMGCCRWFFTLIPAFSRGRRELQGPGIRGFRLRGNDGANRPYIHTGTRVRGAVA